MRFFAMIVALFFGACAMSHKIGKEIEITGIVQKFGSEPKSFLGIKSNNKVYKVSNEEVLAKKQGEVVKVDAIIIKKALGPGFPAIIKVISIK